MMSSACPTAVNQVAVSEPVATKLGVARSDKVGVGSFRFQKQITATVVGIYRPARLLDPYWVNTDLLDNQGSRTSGRSPGTYDDAAFVVEKTLLDGRPNTIDLTYHARLPDNLFGRTDGFDLTAELSRAAHDL